MTNPTAELAARIITAIEKRPATHDQSDWMAGATRLTADEEVGCGTTLCVAGYAAHLTGYTLELASGVVRASKNGLTDYVDHVARTELGITADDAEDLFYGELDRDDVLAALRYLANGETIDWASL
ncbi:hypothetical protein [Streptomyces lydicus]|uniref:hypothetical protein n=1 Tax=Streptomyces lydicus TaxID=47763 RepID=UPI001011FEA6|nr:hypothetical protein [Streptomyces lydicus]MCZ1012358.1 hypothetical protein [Streptomyces lydicus]